MQSVPSILGTLRYQCIPSGNCKQGLSSGMSASADVFWQQTWREFISMAVGTILGVSYRKQTASFVRKGCAMRAAWGVLFLSLVVNTSNCSAQTVGASLQGTVYDASGGFVPGAAIEIRNVEQGAVRTLTTDDKGRYREPLLPPGEYELRVRAAGFQVAVLKGVKLTIGQDAVLDVKLEITGSVERVNVTAEDAPPIDLGSAALSGTVNRMEMNDLPLNGRSFQELALLQPGVNAAVAAGSDAVGGRGKNITINGARPDQNSFLLDGSDINNVYNKTPGSVAGVLLGVETVQEFQGLTNCYSAKFGRS